MDCEQECEESIQRMTQAIHKILQDSLPSIYLYGSCVLKDFQMGWSDIDILVLTQKKIREEQAMELVGLRQVMLSKEPGNPYYRSFEGGMLSLSGFCSKKPERVVYWGTSGERITDTYAFDSFCMTELLTTGQVLCGEDIRGQLTMPTYQDLYQDVKRHYESIRQYAQTTGRNFYSFGWLLDIARGIYTLRTGLVTAKTDAAQWALDQKICPVPNSLELALKVRRNPMAYRDNREIFDTAEKLGPDIQQFADVLERELQEALTKF